MHIQTALINEKQIFLPIHDVIMECLCFLFSAIISAGHSGTDLKTIYRKYRRSPAGIFQKSF